MLILLGIVILYVISLLEQVYAMTKADPNAEKKCLWQILLAYFGERLLPFARAIIFRNQTDSDSELRRYLNFKFHGKQSRTTAN